LPSQQKSPINIWLFQIYAVPLHYQKIVERLNDKTMGNLQSTLYPQKCKNQLLCLFFAPNIWNNQLLCLFLQTKLAYGKKLID
jgi:hypothetical protein